MAPQVGPRGGGACAGGSCLHQDLPLCPVGFWAAPATAAVSCHHCNYFATGAILYFRGLFPNCSLVSLLGVQLRKQKGNQAVGRPGPPLALILGLEANLGLPAASWSLTILLGVGVWLEGS